MECAKHIILEGTEDEIRENFWRFSLKHNRILDTRKEQDCEKEGLYFLYVSYLE